MLENQLGLRVKELNDIFDQNKKLSKHARQVKHSSRKELSKTEAVTEQLFDMFRNEKILKNELDKEKRERSQTTRHLRVQHK